MMFCRASVLAHRHHQMYQFVLVCAASVSYELGAFAHGSPFKSSPKACEHKPRQTELLRHGNQKPHIFKACCIGLETIAQKTRNVPLTQNPLVPFSTIPTSSPPPFILKWPTASALLQQSNSESILGLDGCAPAGIVLLSYLLPV